MNFVPLKGTDEMSASLRIPFKTLHTMSLFLAAENRHSGHQLSNSVNVHWWGSDMIISFICEDWAFHGTIPKFIFELLMYSSI
jgi:hypothetical protein